MIRLESSQAYCKNILPPLKGIYAATMTRFGTDDQLHALSRNLRNSSADSIRFDCTIIFGRLESNVSYC